MKYKDILEESRGRPGLFTPRPGYGYNTRAKPDLIQGNNHSWVNQNNKKHRSDGPAEIQYDGQGNVEMEAWFNNGIFHRNNGPAITYYDNRGNVEIEKWFKNGTFHRDHGPAITYYDSQGKLGAEEWFENGKMHRDEGPSGIYYNDRGKVEKVKWYKNDVEYNPSAHELMAWEVRKLGAKRGYTSDRW